MNTNIFNDYFNYKIKKVLEYSIFLSRIIGVEKNKLWKQKKNIEKSLEWVVKDYFNSLFVHSNSDDIVRIFINDKDLAKYKINNELVSAINYFIKKGRAFEIKAYEKEIVLLAVIVHIANNLDTTTSPYKHNKNNYRTILISYIEKFNKIPYFNNIDNGKKNINLLLELIKSNVKEERKIFDTVSSKASFNRYIDISKENTYYLSQYNYSINSNISKEALKYVYEHNNIDDDFVLISKDLSIITLMKLLSLKRLNKMIFIPIKGSFFENENNVLKLSMIYDNRITAKFIKILINYNDCDDTLKELLIKYKIDYYLYCSKNTVINDYNEDKYLLSRDYTESNQDVVNKLKNSNKQIIIERFDGIVNENELLKESEE